MNGMDERISELTELCQSVPQLIQSAVQEGISSLTGKQSVLDTELENFSITVQDLRWYSFYKGHVQSVAH